MNISKEKIDYAINESLKKIDSLKDKLGNFFPIPCTNNGKYDLTQNVCGWTTNFWTGELWLAYELTGNEKYKKAAMEQMESYEKRARERIGMNDHDIGFVFSLSTVAGYKITGDERLREVSLVAADLLTERFRERGGFIQLIGDETAPKEHYCFIIDCLMNLNLLFWAKAQTGNKKYSDIARIHFYTTLANAIREDGSSFQNVYFDSKTGEVTQRGSKQGLNETSCWSRGQGWVLYGLPLAYSRIKDEKIFDIYEKSFNCFSSKLPGDFVPFWDLVFDEKSGEPRDSSAAAIAVCGLKEAIKYVKDDVKKAKIQRLADNMMNSLIDKYTSFNDKETEGLLIHGSCHVKENVGVDECMIWGDYFFMEALMRYKNPDWNCYWSD